MGWVGSLACFRGRQQGDTVGLCFSLSTEFRTEIVRSMARNGKEYQYDCFGSHLGKITHVQGSCKYILNTIYKNCVTLPTFLLLYPQEIKYLDGFFALTT